MAAPPIPASTSYPVAQQISAGGTPYYSSIVLLASNGLAYSVTIGPGPAWVFTPIPTVADIRADFATVAIMRAAVPTVAALRTWGF